MSDVKHPLTSWIYMLAPAAILFFLFHPKVAFVPAIALSGADPMAPFAAALVGLVPGYILYKRTRTVRSHEWHRVQALKKLGKHYATDDSEAWHGDDPVTLRTTGGSVELGDLGKAALERMQGRVGDLMMDDTSVQQDISDEAEVDMLLERDHVALAAARVRGDVTMEEKSQASTIGQEERATGVDAALDWVALKVARRKRDAEKKQAPDLPETSFAANPEPVASSAAVEYDNLIVNSWHCRQCQKMNPTDSPYCEQCGTGK